jgi:hypothetical protein
MIEHERHTHTHTHTHTGLNVAQRAGELADEAVTDARVIKHLSVQKRAFRNCTATVTKQEQDQL